MNIRLLNSIILGLIGMTVSGNNVPDRPRLVVGIVIDQLRTDYLDFLKPYFSESGFRSLMDSGIYFRDVDFKVKGLDIASGTAMAVTGAYPASNNITSALSFDPGSMTLSPILGIGQQISPEKISLSTLTDEIAIDGIGLSSVYSIATDPQQATILAGHAGNSAVWIDPDNGLWTSAKYYGTPPHTITAANSGRKSLPQRIDTIHWSPLLPLNSYPGIPRQKKYYPFRYTYPSSDRQTYRRFASSPMGNREVTDLAIDYLRTLNIGRDGDKIDVLNIGYRLDPCADVKDGDSRIETEDAYLRLDRDLSRLLQELNKDVGLENTLIYILPTGYYNDAVADDPKYRIPTGEFSVRRAESLLNSYLSAKYGSADYISAFDGRNIYFSSSALRSATSSPDQIKQDAALFLRRMAGIEYAYPMSEILAGADPVTRQLRLGVSPESGSDIIIKIKPGWTLLNDAVHPNVKTHVRDAAVAVPALIMGAGIKAVTIDSPIEAVALAPTIAQSIRIRAPNGASARALQLRR